tara:strand:+ start:274 stop:945 length:672 start_codon:yes stop_codon:yes gene_type:complete
MADPLFEFLKARRESTGVYVDERTEEQKKREELERRRRAEYLKASFPSAISASEQYTGSGQISQKQAKRAGYLAGEFASEIIPGGRVIKGAPDLLKAALVPTPTNIAIGASRLVPGVLGGGALTRFLKGTKRANDLGTAIGDPDPDAGRLAIAAGALFGKKIPSLGHLKSTTKGMTREEAPIESPVLSPETIRMLKKMLGTGQAVADPLSKTIQAMLGRSGIG